MSVEGPSILGSKSVGVVRAGAAQVRASRSAPVRSDSVQVSDAAAALSATRSEALAGGASDIQGADEAKVAALKAELASGYFPVDVYRLARDMMRDL